MGSRARYPPPGMGGGGRGGGGMQPNAGPNPDFLPRNPTQQYGPRSSHSSNQMFQNAQQQQWMKRTQLPPADSGVDEVEKTVQPEAVDSRLFLLA